MNIQEKPDLMPRFLAALIDGLLSGLVSTIIPVIGAIASTVYMLTKDGLFEGQSIGKKVMKLQVVTIEGQKADYGTSVRRNIIFAIPTFIMIIPILGWIVAPFVALAVMLIEVIKVTTDPQGRRLGDNWANTQVVKFEEKSTEQVS